MKKFGKFLLAGAFLSPLLFASPAKAEYCREYQKTIRVGGSLESGYGTACMQPDGSWMIVDSRGNVDPFDDLRNQNVVIMADQPVYYTYGPALRPVRYYPRTYYYRPNYRPPYTTSFFFNFGDNDHWDNGRHGGRDRWDNDRHTSHYGRNHH